MFAVTFSENETISIFAVRNIIQLINANLKYVFRDFFRVGYPRPPPPPRVRLLRELVGNSGLRGSRFGDLAQGVHASRIPRGRFGSRIWLVFWFGSRIWFVFWFGLRLIYPSHPYLPFYLLATIARSSCRAALLATQGPPQPPL